MKQLVTVERFCLIGHIVTMVFGLAGLVLVVPHPELIMNLGETGQTAFQWSMAGGGVVNIVLGTIAVAIYAYRKLGLWHWLTFMLPAVCLSLGSELLGTSTGFPFGDYSYLNGLGYKIGGLVPFTIPLSWFYMGLVSYLIACAGLKTRQNPSLVRYVGAIALAAMMFTSWDFALEPAMSQTMVPFWYWEHPGAFFGTPYRNYAGWFGTSSLFIGVGAMLWRKTPILLERNQLGFPLTIYLSNFGYAAGLSLAAGYWIPVSLGVIVGVIPALTLWQLAKPADVKESTTETPASMKPEIPVTQVKVAVK